MSFTYQIIAKNKIDIVIPLVYDLNKETISKEVLKSRFKEMINQNYECAGIFDGDDLVGITGLWFFTRHYTGKSVELDHVYIKPEYRNQGLGKQFIDWITSYCKDRGCESVELNTYVGNYPSHKFYYNEGMESWGYHFFKHL
jgi:GNAT superfamily N-acetyltransferase